MGIKLERIRESRGLQKVHFDEAWSASDETRVSRDERKKVISTTQKMRSVWNNSCNFVVDEQEKNTPLPALHGGLYH